MHSRLPTLEPRFERILRSADPFESDRMRRVVRAQLLDEPPPVLSIGPYRVHEPIGSGGMGMVYEATDDRLQRRVAVKLVRSRGSRPADQRRLVREARALARLQHPNVVEVYDVGVFEGRVFLAMELVRGRTLRAFAEATRDWQSVLAAYLQAGQGLGAAHAAGLVHRDFKPDNALIDDEGRVYVLDFGLAVEDGSEDAPSREDVSASLSSSSLTLTGHVVGTPAYMAPEYLEGAPADARSDQFALCVSIWEGVYGRRPFTGRSRAELFAAIRRRRPSAPPRDRDVPTWLRTALERGLAGDPASRWPSIAAFVDACGSRRRPRRPPPALLAAGVVVGTLVAAGPYALSTDHDTACLGPTASVDDVWNEAEARAVAAAFAATNLPYALDTARRVADELDEWARQWSDVASRACNPDGREVDNTTMRRRQACLSEQAASVSAFVEVARSADRKLVNAAVRSVLALPSPHDCEDDQRLAAGAVHDAAPAGTANELRRRLARARQLATLGRRDDAIAQAQRALASAQALGSPLLVAEASHGVALAHLSGGGYDAAVQALERAFFSATSVDADELAMEAATRLVLVLGVRLGRFDDGRQWVRHAEMLLDRLGESHDWRAAALWEQAGSLERLAGNLDLARDHYERSLRLRIEHGGPEHPQVGDAWADLGGLHVDRGDLDSAQSALDAAERILVTAYGADSLELGGVYSSRCSLEFARGHFDAARSPCERILRTRQGRLDPDDPSIALAMVNLANVRAELGDLEVARMLMLQALEIRRARLPPKHPRLASVLSNLGVTETRLGRLTEATSHLREALEIQEGALPAGHHDLANTRLNLADVLRARGRLTEAREAYERATDGLSPGAATNDLFARAHQGAQEPTAGPAPESSPAFRPNEENPTPQ